MGARRPAPARGRGAAPLARSSILRLLNDADGGIGEHEDVLLERHGPGVCEQRGEHLAPLTFAHALEHRGPQRVQLGRRRRRRMPAPVPGRAPASAERRRRAGRGARSRAARRAADRPCARSSRSIRISSASTDASALGRAAFSSATSSWVRGSAPSFTAAIASASRSIARTASACVRSRAWSSSRAIWSAVTLKVSGGSPSVCTTISWRRCAVRSRMNWTGSRPDSAQLLHAAQRGRRVARDHGVGRGEDQVGVGHVEQLEHVVEGDLLAAVGDELVERADRVAEAAGGGARDHRQARGRRPRCPPPRRSARAPS